MRPTSGSSAWLPGRYGAGEQPQLPATIVVMPCSSSGASTSAWSGCGITQSLCECMSMKPGAITWPAQSRRRAALAVSSAPTAAMRPSAIATEAGKPSRPVPASTVPWSRMRSKVMCRPSHAQTPWHNVHRPPLFSRPQQDQSLTVAGATMVDDARADRPRVRRGAGPRRLRAWLAAQAEAPHEVPTLEIVSDDKRLAVEVLDEGLIHFEFAPKGVP